MLSLTERTFSYRCSCLASGHEGAIVMLSLSWWWPDNEHAYNDGAAVREKRVPAAEGVLGDVVGHKGVGGHVIQRRNLCLSSIVHLRGSRGICTKEVIGAVLPEECACGVASPRRDPPPYATSHSPSAW